MSESNLNADLGLTDNNGGCSCGHMEHNAAPDTAGADVVRAHYLVSGMTCSHCVASVTEELSAVPGVDSVSVALNVGGVSTVMVVSSAPVPVGEVRAAIAEAGYEMVAG
ncbi:heavy-metal-associated domain-containing protein [Subtercola boreus]|nr:heavy metal-associated domain-containing protein [Subtercola boreus]